MDLSKLSDADLAAVESGDMSKVSDEGLAIISGEPAEKKMEAKDYATRALEYGGRGLDYLGGLSRGGIAGLLEGATGKELVDSGDVLRGRAPSSSEILEKLGVGEGGKLSDILPMYAEPGKGGLLTPEKGGLLDPSVRGTVGTALDIASDPLTYASLGTAPIAKGATKLFSKKLPSSVVEGEINLLKTLLNPGKKAVQKAGETLYKSGLKNIDTRIVEKGGEAVSPYLMEQGVWGRLPSIEKGIQSRIDELSEARKGLYAQAPSARVTPAAAQERAFEGLVEMEKNPYKKSAVEKQLEFLGQATEPVSLEQASAIKSDLYDALPSSAFDEGGRLTNDGKRMLKDLSLGYKTAIEQAADAQVPGLGKQISDLNTEWGSLIAAQKPTRSEISKAGRKNLLTEIKALVGINDPVSAGAMYGAQALNSAPVRTGVGLGLRTAGQNVPEGVWRRMVIDSMLQDKEKNK